MLSSSDKARDTPSYPGQWVYRRDLPLLVLLVVLLATLLPSLNIGFVSDDYEHLVEATAKLPLTASFDEMHRPLRNAIFKISYLAFGLSSAPYHLGLILLHLAAVTALYYFTMQLTANRWAAILAAAFYGFFPRNHQTVFWIAAGQDSVVALCALIACSAFLSFKKTRRFTAYCLALLAFCAALGFKETAIAILPLLLLIDLSCDGRPMIVSPRENWKVFLPLMIIGAAAAIWMHGTFDPNNHPHSFYNVQSPGQTMKMSAKYALNMLFPFSSPLEVKPVMRDPALLLIALIVSFTTVTCAILFVSPRKLFLVAGWWLVTTLPTAVIGQYADRYLGLPFIALAILFAFIVEGSFPRMKTRMPLGFVVVTLLATYAAVSIQRLSSYRRLWEQAAQEIQNTMAEAHRLVPVLPPGSVLYFVNLTHSLANGQVYVFNTGFNGMMLASGYDKSVTGHEICNRPDTREPALVRRLLDCRPQLPPPNNHYVFLAQERLINVSGPCAERAVAISLQEDPQLWR